MEVHRFFKAIKLSDARDAANACCFAFSRAVHMRDGWFRQAVANLIRVFSVQRVLRRIARSMPARA